ncbi:MAG: hypothetical protein H7Y30_16355 [Pyrinomonadaceae bacterium]|nr:hypothetical protein [Pyrinomonadaceae bacterium]
MPQPFKCPSCGGPLEYDGGKLTVRCQFCNSSIIVPEELRPRAAAPTRDADVTLQDQLGNLAEIGRLIRDGNKIEAIKVYRETFGTGLKEAKEAIERLMAGKSVEVMQGFESHTVQPQIQVSQTSFGAPRQAYGAKRPQGCSPLIIGLGVLVGVLLFSSAVGFLIYNSARRDARKPVPNRNNPHTVPRGSEKSSPASGFASVLLKFGTEGIGAGQFKDARSVAVDGEGNIYAADYIGGRVQVFDSSGKFLTQWMVDPKMPLLRLAADRKGVVYVVQSGDINRYEGMTGQSLGKVPATGRWFNDVVVTPDGGLVATQNGQDIVRFDSSGRTLSTITKAITEQTGDSELDTKIAVDGLGNIYALGIFNDAVFKFAPNGKFITRIGGEGEESGLFRAPHSIAVDGQGRIYVSDIKGIQVFDTNGRYLDVFKVEKNVAFVMVFNDRNELFVAARTEIVKFALNK